MRKEKTKRKITGLDDERGIRKTQRRSSTSRNMKLLEVWTCQRAENLKRKSSKIPKNNYAATMVSAARRQIIGGGGAPINKSRRRRRPQIVGGAAGARLYCRVDIPGLNLHRTHTGLYDDKEETCLVSESSCIEDTLSKIVIPRLQIVAGRVDTLESQTHHIRPILLVLHCHWHQLYNTARRMLPCSLTKFHYCQPENDTDRLHLHQSRQTVGSSTCL